MFHGHLDYFQKPPLGGRPNTKPFGDHGTPNAHNCWFILSHHVWGPAWIKIHWKSTWVEGPVTYGFTLHLRIRDVNTWFWRCVGMTFGHFFLGSPPISWSWLLTCSTCVAQPIRAMRTWHHPHLPPVYHWQFLVSAVHGMDCQLFLQRLGATLLCVPRYESCARRSTLCVWSGPKLS